MIYIYTLSDPRTGEIRYVGKTSCKLRKRLIGHLSEARNRNMTHKNHWVLSLMKEGLEPIIEIIDEYEYDDWEWLEIMWLDLLKSWGFNMTNSAEAGGQPPSWKGKTHSQEHKDKLSRLMRENNPSKNMDDEWRKNISEAHKRNGFLALAAIESNKKKVIQYTLDGDFVDEYDSITDAAKAVGLKTSNTVAMVCRGERKKAGGYKWGLK